MAGMWHQFLLSRNLPINIPLYPPHKSQPYSFLFHSTQLSNLFIFHKLWQLWMYLFRKSMLLGEGLRRRRRRHQQHLREATNHIHKGMITKQLLLHHHLIHPCPTKRVLATLEIMTCSLTSRFNWLTNYSMLLLHVLMLDRVCIWI